MYTLEQYKVIVVDKINLMNDTSLIVLRLHHTHKAEAYYGGNLKEIADKILVAHFCHAFSCRAWIWSAF